MRAERDYMGTTHNEFTTYNKQLKLTGKRTTVVSYLVMSKNGCRVVSSHEDYDRALEFMEHPLRVGLGLQLQKRTVVTEEMA